MAKHMEKHLELLGMKVTDKVTGEKGIVTSISFDLYGCVQAVIDPGLDGEGKKKDSHWYDVARLKVTGKKPVMDVPDFTQHATPQTVSAGRQGAAEKPLL